MIKIPNWAQSSIDENSVSLTVQSVGKSIASLIVLAGVVGIVDPNVAGEAWSGFVASIITAVPAGFAVYHSGQAVWGVIRKISARIFTVAA